MIKKVEKCPVCSTISKSRIPYTYLLNEAVKELINEEIIEELVAVIARIKSVNAGRLVGTERKVIVLIRNRIAKLKKEYNYDGEL